MQSIRVNPGSGTVQLPRGSPFAKNRLAKKNSARADPAGFVETVRLTGFQSTPGHANTNTGLGLELRRVRRHSQNLMDMRISGYSPPFTRASHCCPSRRAAQSGFLVADMPVVVVPDSDLVCSVYYITSIGFALCRVSSIKENIPRRVCPSLFV